MTIALLGVDGSGGGDGYAGERRVGEIGVLDQGGGCGQDAFDDGFDALFGQGGAVFAGEDFALGSDQGGDDLGAAEVHCQNGFACG